MSYYLGQSAIPVKPVTRRDTWTRGMPRATQQAYLQQPGRCPINRKSYPVSGRPVAMSRRGVPVRATLGTWIPTDMSLEPGQQMGGWMEDTIASMTKLVTPTTSSVPSVIAAPAKEEPGFLSNLLTGAMNLWDSRPQVLKNISLKVDPNVAMAAAQKLVSAGQVSKAVDYLRSVGINPSYLGVPVTGAQAGYGYQLAGMNIQQYLPWIIGGGAVLLILPMVLGKK